MHAWSPSLCTTLISYYSLHHRCSRSNYSHDDEIDDRIIISSSTSSKVSSGTVILQCYDWCIKISCWMQSAVPGPNSMYQIGLVYCASLTTWQSQTKIQHMCTAYVNNQQAGVTSTDSAANSWAKFLARDSIAVAHAMLSALCDRLSVCPSVWHTGGPWTSPKRLS